MRTLLKSLKKPTNLFYAIGSAFLIFDLSFYAMITLPGTKNNTCILGGNFTTQNAIFSIILSICLGIIISGMITLFKQKQTNSKTKVASITGIATILSGGTMFCSICTLPILTLIGLGTFFYFFLEYSIIIQLISLGMIIFSMHLLSQQLEGNCKLGCKL